MSQFFKKIIFGSALFSVLILFSTSALASELVGKWLDDEINIKVTITHSSSGYTAHYTAPDGSGFKRKLVPFKIKTPGMLALWEEGNEAGEFYVINPSGSLGSYDREGLITTLRAIN